MWTRRVGLCGILLGTAVAAACSNSTTEPNATVQEQVSYINQLVQHHQIATIRADEALAKANRPGLKTLATRMKTDQTREIAQLRSILTGLVGTDTTAPPMAPLPIPAGPEFERQWLTMLINHHQGAIDLSTLAHGSNVRSQLDSIAHSVITVQTREQQEFRDSLRVYYP